MCEECRLRLDKLDMMLMALLNTESSIALVLANPNDRAAKEALNTLTKQNLNYINSTISKMKEKEKEDEN